jgi:hypothetical protein
MGQPYILPVAVPVQPRTTNGSAIFAFIMALLWIGGLGSLLGLLVGIAARKEIAAKGQAGDGLAIAASIIGGLGLFFTVLSAIH